MAKEDTSKRNVERILDKMQQLTAGASASLAGRMTRIDIELREGPLWLKVGIQAASASEATPAAGGSVARPLFNKPGHGVVAIIARNLLQSSDPAAWETLDSLLRADPRRTIIKAARWPDDMKSDPEFKRRTGAFHFVDIVWPEGDDPDPNAPLPEEPHAVQKLPEFIAEFESKTGEERIDALSWVIHLVGDLHQPLHCIARVNEENPAPFGDRGGNNFVLGDGTRLHGLWDDILISSASASNSRIERVAGEIADELPENAFSANELDDLDPERWARAGYEVAIRNVYDGIEEGGEASEEYMERASRVGRRLAALGGYRLARVLKKLAASVDA